MSNISSLKPDLDNKLFARHTARAILNALGVNKNLPRTGRKLLVQFPNAAEVINFSNLGTNMFLVTVK